MGGSACHDYGEQNQVLHISSFLRASSPGWAGLRPFSGPEPCTWIREFRNIATVVKTANAQGINWRSSGNQARLRGS
jgi:hypothetical protein